MIGVPSSFLIGCLWHISLWSLQARGCSAQCLIHIFGHIRHTWKLTFGIRVTKNVKGVSYWFLIGRLMWCCRRIYLWSSQTCHQLSKKIQKRISGKKLVVWKESVISGGSCDGGVAIRLYQLWESFVFWWHTMSQLILPTLSQLIRHTHTHTRINAHLEKKHTTWHAALIDIQHI